MPKPSQLFGLEKKRATKDIPIFLDAQLYGNLEDLINTLRWNYRSLNKDKLIMRDKALVSLLILTGVRISEALRLKRKQFRIYKNRILLVNVETLKHGKLRKELTLPKHGRLTPFTVMFETWLNEIPEQQEESYIFPTGTINGFLFDQPITRYRANAIIKTIGKFPHWFRAVCENIYGKKVFNNNAYKLKDFMGLVNLSSTDPYIQADWEEDKEKVFKL